MAISVMPEDSDTPLATVTVGDGGRKLENMTWEEARKMPLFMEPGSYKWEEMKALEDIEMAYFVSKPFAIGEGNATVTIEAARADMEKGIVRHISLRKTK